MSGLNDYLLDKKEAIRAQRRRVESGEVGRKRIETKVTAVDRAGVRRISIRGHHLLTDSGPETGGFDLGPTPVELLLGALGGCIAHTFIVQAAVRGVELDALEVTVSANSDPRGGTPAHPEIPGHPTDITYEIEVTSPASDEQIRTVYEVAERVCPVTALLAQPQTVTGSLVHTAPTASLAATTAAS